MSQFGLVRLSTVTREKRYPWSHKLGKGKGKGREMGLEKEKNSSNKLREKFNLLNIIVESEIIQYNTI